MAAEPRQTLPRSVRIRSKRVFDAIFAARVRASDRWIALYAGRSEGGPARLGIAAGRRLGNAVVRNRRKRLVREAFRRIRHQLPAGTDWIVQPRPGEEPSVPQLQASILILAARLIARLPASPSAAEAPKQEREGEQ